MSSELTEEQEERAAILEYDAGYSREEAERMAVEMSKKGVERLVSYWKEHLQCWHVYVRFCRLLTQTIENQ